MTINEYVCIKRKEKKFSRNRLGMFVGLSAQNIYCLEKNNRRVDEKQANKLAEALCVDKAEFICLWKQSLVTPINRNWKKEVERCKRNREAYVSQA